MPRAYICAPFIDAPMVRAVHETLRALGIEPCSRWAETASGAEGFLGEQGMRDVAAANDRDLRGADAVLVVARVGAGAEMFAEARMAIEWGKPVFWVGHTSLSAWRLGVTRCASVTEAVSLIARTLRGERSA